MNRNVLLSLVSVSLIAAAACATKTSSTGPAEPTESTGSTETTAPAETPAPTPSGGETPPPPSGEATPPPPSGEAVVGPPQVAWADMTKEQKGKYMKAVVTPEMAKIFRAHDAKEFEKFGCGTCHGSKAKDRKFEMPNPEIEELPNSQAGWAELQKEHPEDVKFMAEKVKPAMAKLLGKPEFDPNNPDPKSFGCSGCHTTKK